MGQFGLGFHDFLHNLLNATGLPPVGQLRAEGDANPSDLVAYDAALGHYLAVGRIAFQGGRGPREFSVSEMTAALENLLGKKHAMELWKLGIEAVEDVKSYIARYKIECGIQKGVMLAGYYPKDNINFLNEIEHMQKNYDFNKFEYFNSKEIKEEINSNKYNYQLNLCEEKLNKRGLFGIL